MSAPLDNISSDVLARLSALGNELHQEERELKKREQSLEAQKARVKELTEVTIPELMDSVGLSAFTTREGIPLKVTPQVHAHIAKEREKAAHDWLEANGYGGMIRRKVVVEFNRDQEEEAKELVDELNEQYPLVVQEKSVHSSTLRSFAREQLEAGADIPLDLFGIHTRRVAKIG